MSLPGLVIVVLHALAVSSKDIQWTEDEADFESRLAALENTVKQQNNIITRQNVLITDLKEMMLTHTPNIKEQLRVQDTLFGDMVPDLKMTGNTSEKKRFVLDTIETVVFEATMAGTNKQPHTHVNDIVIFETASLNVGNGYNSGNGTFTAPMGGLYIFSTSVMMTTSSAVDLGMHVIIEKNGAEIAGAYAHNHGSYEHSSVTAAMSLQAGDMVSVNVERHNDISFYGDNLSSFMGFLLYPF